MKGGVGTEGERRAIGEECHGMGERVETETDNQTIDCID